MIRANFVRPNHSSLMDYRVWPVWLCLSKDQLKSKVQKMLREKHRRLVSFESDFLAAIDVRTDSSVVGFFSVNEGGKREQDGRRREIGERYSRERERERDRERERERGRGERERER